MWTRAPPRSSALTSSPVAAFTSGGPARKMVPVPLHDDGLVAHRRDVGAAGGAAAHHRRELRDAGGGEHGLVVEDPPEVLAVGEDLGLQRQERAPAVHQVEAGQPVLERDLLRAQVLLHRERVVGAALHRRVVGDDHARPPVHHAHARHQARRGDRIVVDLVRGEQADLQERRGLVAQRGDAVAHEHLALARVARVGLLAPALAQHLLAALEVLAERQVVRVVRPVLLGRGLQVALDERHGRPPGAFT